MDNIKNLIEKNLIKCYQIQVNNNNKNNKNNNNEKINKIYIGNYKEIPSIINKMDYVSFNKNDEKTHLVLMYTHILTDKEINNDTLNIIGLEIMNIKTKNIINLDICYNNSDSEFNIKLNNSEILQKIDVIKDNDHMIELLYLNLQSNYNLI
jgi:hypothetical protein